MIGTIIGTFIAVAALMVVIYPFVKERRSRPPAAAGADVFTARRDQIYRMIAELEQDRLAGEVTDGEFQLQLIELRAAAAAAMQEADAAGLPGTGAEERLEEEVRAARDAHAGHKSGGRT